jgi:hypothetical protein
MYGRFGSQSTALALCEKRARGLRIVSSPVKEIDFQIIAVSSSNNLKVTLALYFRPYTTWSLQTA